MVFAWLIVTASIMAVNIVVIPVTIYFGFAYELPPWDIAILFCGFIEIGMFSRLIEQFHLIPLNDSNALYFNTGVSYNFERSKTINTFSYTPIV